MTGTVGAHSLAAWERWDGWNVAVDEEGVRLQTESLPAYGAGEAVGLDAGAVRDVAAVPCGHCYLLDDAGGLHRYDPGLGELRTLSCVWQASDAPRALCVTADTIYVAGTGRVQAISRHRHQTRWVAAAGVDEARALATCDGAAYLLDGGGEAGGGRVSRVCPDGRIRPVVNGLVAPRDLACGPEGGLSVLDAAAGPAPESDPTPALRRFPTDDLVPGEPVDATDHVRIAPEAFRVDDRTASPACLAVGASGDILVGEADSRGRRALLCYRPWEGHFEAHGFVGECVALAAPPRTDDGSTVFAVDGDGHLRVLDGRFRTRRLSADREGTTVHDRIGSPTPYRGQIVGRFDAGELGTVWDRVRLDVALDGPQTEVRVSYAATDADRRPPEPPDETGAPLETIEGIGETYAGRLREWGVDGVAQLADLTPAAVRSIVSVEEIDVPPATVEGWIEAAEALLADPETDGATLESIAGIGPVYAARLRASGIETPAALVDRDPNAVARLVSTETLTVSLARAESWVARARERQPPPRTYDDLDWTEVTPSTPREALLSGAEGRYLWVAIELVGTADAGPTVESFDATYPRETYLEYLPAVYRENPDFLERYLSLFESVFEDVEAAIAALTGYMDPEGVPPEHLAWLGRWLAVDVDDAWPEAATREFVDRAPELYRMRGTRRGLLVALGIYLEHVAVPRPSWERALEREADHLEDLVEAGKVTAAEAEQARSDHAALAAEDPAEEVGVLTWTDLPPETPEAAREPFEGLLGCPSGVLVLVHPAVDAEDVAALGHIAEAHEPAHASGRTVPLRRRVRLTGTDCGDGGFHTYLGANSVLTEPTYTVEESSLGRETVLSGHEPDGQLDVQARLGEDARLS